MQSKTAIFKGHSHEYSSHFDLPISARALDSIGRGGCSGGICDLCADRDWRPRHRIGCITIGQVPARGLRVRIVAPDVAPGKTLGIVSHIDAQSIVVSLPGRDVVFPVDKIMALDISASSYRFSLLPRIDRERGIEMLIAF